MAIEINVNDNEIQEKLQELLRKSADLTPAMREIAGFLGTYTKLIFNSEGETLSKRWKPLKESTIKNKVKRGAWLRMILTDSYQLEQSIQQYHSSKEAGVYTNKVYAKLHQFGSKGPVSVPSHTRTRKGKTFTVKAFTMNINVPARPFFGFSDEAKKMILNIVLKHLVEESK
jgi:phage virion morphogenesis protein